LFFSLAGHEVLNCAISIAFQLPGNVLAHSSSKEFSLFASYFYYIILFSFRLRWRASLAIYSKGKVYV
jgi:hypothetical protein